jgi:hypothetical protein
MDLLARQIRVRWEQAMRAFDQAKHRKHQTNLFTQNACERKKVRCAIETCRKSWLMPLPAERLFEASSQGRRSLSNGKKCLKRSSIARATEAKSPSPYCNGFRWKYSMPRP